MTVSPTATAELPPFRQYICNACGWIYDEAKGDPDSGLAPGTRFEDIPDDWACPLCAVTKADFSPYTPPPARPGGLATGIGAGSSTAVARRLGAQTTKGVVIVGGGRAAWQMAQALREADAQVPITLVAACAADPYDKPLLSVAVARQLDPTALVRETGAQAAARLNVRLMAQTQATRICPRTQTLTTTRGTLPFDELVLAHGAQVALPPALPAELCWRINHLDAYLRLRAALATGPADIVIVGAGLIGSELANDLALASHRITLLDPLAHPLGRWPASEAGDKLLAAWADLPIQFVGGVQVAAVQADGERRRVRTACGQSFEADQVIAATGLLTPSRLAQSAGLTWANGIAVDAHTLATSHARIHALGDCVAIGGATSRYIEPIIRQANTIAAKLAARRQGAALDACPVPYESRPAVVRVKTSSCPLTLH